MRESLIPIIAMLASPAMAQDISYPPSTYAGTVTPSTPTRALNTSFQISTTNSALACYSIVLSTTNPLLAGTSTAQAQLVSDASSTPTTARGTAAISSSVALAVAIALTTGNTVQLCYLVPAGHWVRLNSSTSGTGSVSISSQVEEILG